MSWRRILGGALTAWALLASCGSGDDEASGATDVNGGAPRPRYREVSVSNAGRIVGTLSLSADTIPAAHALDPIAACGVVPRRARQAPSVRALAMVWLADVRSGKAIPIEKRFTVTTEYCDIQPRVQAAIAGGMLNVLNTDPLEHRTRFTAAGRTAPSGDASAPLAVITQFDAGQIVPRSDLLASPGIVEITCDLHPWTRGWIHVFDHPYFAEVRSDGRFVIDSVLPGDYRLMLWHERLGTREVPVTVRAGVETPVAPAF